MPLMGGIECTGEIRNLEAKGVIQQRLPIIAVTANARSGQVQEVCTMLKHQRLELTFLSVPDAGVRIRRCCRQAVLYKGTQRED